MDDDNIFKFDAVKGGKQDEEDDKFPINDYVITDIDGAEWYDSGFLVFTSHHVAIMRTTKSGGAIPSLVIPIDRVKVAELNEATVGE